MDLVGYLAPNFIENSQIEGSFAFVKDADHYTLYTHKNPRHFAIIYYPSHPEFKKIKDIYPQDYMFNEIKCAFENSEFKGEIINPPYIIHRQSFKSIYYSKDKGGYRVIYEKSCLEKLRTYVFYELRLGFTIKMIFEHRKTQ
ncbi:hypothetical protein [Bartonella sp. HY761]|uniref:hypothetical protein n=1 Tax=Bartonella sp. HY761 TaxID=2979330 RepID=UPI0021E315D5|nr:hypothetical protein [Bartonella sp. HY761]UXN07917.1 hypothetical protein N6A79_15010 [Bartonella sp. HY761]